MLPCSYFARATVTYNSPKYILFHSAGQFSFKCRDGKLVSLLPSKLLLGTINTESGFYRSFEQSSAINLVVH